MFTGTLISQEDVYWVKKMCVESDGPKWMKLRLQRCSSHPNGVRGQTSLEATLRVTVGVSPNDTSASTYLKVCQDPHRYSESRAHPCYGPMHTRRPNAVQVVSNGSARVCGDLHQLIAYWSSRERMSCFVLFNVFSMEQTPLSSDSIYSHSVLMYIWGG